MNYCYNGLWVIQTVNQVSTMTSSPRFSILTPLARQSLTFFLLTIKFQTDSPGGLLSPRMKGLKHTSDGPSNTSAERSDHPNNSGIKGCSLHYPAYPLWVTKHWRSPSFLKMSTTISMGVWSVTVKGLMSRMERSFKGLGLSAGRVGACWVK